MRSAHDPVTRAAATNMPKTHLVDVFQGLPTITFGSGLHMSAFVEPLGTLSSCRERPDRGGRTAPHRRWRERHQLRHRGTNGTARAAGCGSSLHACGVQCILQSAPYVRVRAGMRPFTEARRVGPPSRRSIQLYRYRGMSTRSGRAACLS